jgi:predicted ester cyclase
MSEQNMHTVRRLLQEVWTQGNLALLPELLADKALSRPMPQMGALQGPEEYMHFIAVYKGAFQDMSFNIEDQFSADNKVATRWVATVSDASADAGGSGSGGGQISIDGTTITHHGNDGKIIAEWGTWDTHSLLESTAAPQIYEQLHINI